MSGAGGGDWVVWQFGVPNLILFAVALAILWYKLYMLRVSLMKTIDGVIERLRETAPPYAVGEQFVEGHFEELRQAIRELTVRIEHVEHMLDSEGDEE